MFRLSCFETIMISYNVRELCDLQCKSKERWFLQSLYPKSCLFNLALCSAFCLDKCAYVLVTRMFLTVFLSFFLARKSLYYVFWPSSYSIRVQLIFSIKPIANQWQCCELFAQNLMLLVKTDMSVVFSCFKCDKRKIFNTSCCLICVRLNVYKNAEFNGFL